uniref:Uncharacterized protein n=1 Tax=Naja naja TaxID=35670 RepID=A0A8C6XY44_NAJNA
MGRPDSLNNCGKNGHKMGQNSLNVLPSNKSLGLNCDHNSPSTPFYFLTFTRVYHVNPFRALDLFFPLTRFALSFFLCLGLIHTGYCPC